MVETAAGSCSPSSRPPFFPIAPSVGELDIISPVIADKLFLTNWRGAADRQQLRALGVTHVASIGTEFASDDESDLVYYKKDIYDDEDAEAEMGRSLHEAAAFIAGALSAKNGRCVVHCAAGVSRSTCIVLAYLVLHARMPLREAFALVTGARRAVWPNDGFMRALIALEREARGASSVSIEEYIAWGDYDEPPGEESPPGDAAARANGGGSSTSSEEVSSPEVATRGLMAKVSFQEDAPSISRGSSSTTSVGTSVGSPLNREGRVAFARSASRGAVEARASEGSGSP